MAGIDVSSPGFVVQVLASAKDARLPGRPDPGGAPGQVLERMTDVSIRVESFEFVDAEREFGQLKLVVDNFDLYFLDHPAWVKGNLVRFFWGYPGKIQGPKYAVIDSFRGFQKLTIACTERAALTNEAKNRFWGNTTRAQIIYSLVKENAFPGVTNVEIDNGVLLRQAAANATNLDPKAKAALQAEVSFTGLDFQSILTERARDFQQSNQTDWQFALRLAEEVGFELYVEDAIIHYHPRRLDKVPVRRYEWYTGAGDLLEFNVEEWRAADRAGVVEVAGRDPKSRENLSSTGSNSTTARDTLGNQGAVAQTTSITADKAGKLIVGKKIVRTPRNDPVAVSNFADAQFRALEQGEVEATAEIIGDPVLKAKQVVEIVGISRALSGNYYVEEVSHKIDHGGTYRCRLKLMRNAVTALPTSSPPDLDPKKSKDNAAEVSTDKRNKIIRDPFTGELKQVGSS